MNVFPLRDGGSLVIFVPAPHTMLQARPRSDDAWERGSRSGRDRVWEPESTASAAGMRLSEGKQGGIPLLNKGVQGPLCGLAWKKRNPQGVT